MANIFITHSYFLRFDAKQWQLGRPYPPLGTLYAASCLRANGHRLQFFDAMFCNDSSEITDSIQDDTALFVVYDDGFNYLTKMCLTNMREAAFEMIGIAKQKGLKVIVSGSDATDHYKNYIEAGADCILIGEGENTLVELVAELEKEEPQVSGIPGLAYKKDDVLQKTAPRPVSRELDSFPIPAWDLLDIEPYKRSWLDNAAYFSINIVTTRGCPYKCNWCAKPIYGNRYNTRSAQNVVSELKMLSENFAFEHVWFCDDIFGLKPGWVQEFADLVEHERLNFKFKIQSRADLLVQENYVAALAKAGCKEVWMGAESGSQRVLDAMDKGINVEQIRQATALLKKHHIQPCFFIQFGYLGETKEDINLTIQMIKELMPHEIGISVSYPLPGTGFYEKVKEQLAQKANWTDSDEMALMFRNTYSSSFYKQLHGHVHKFYRKQVAVSTIRSLMMKPFKANWQTLRKAIGYIYLVPAVFISERRLRKLERIA